MDLLHEHCNSGYIPADRRIVSSLIVGGFMRTRNLLACVLLFTVGACWGQQQPTFSFQSLQSNQLGPVTMQLSAGSQNLLAPSTDGLSVDPSAQNGLPIISDPTSQNISTSGSYTLTVGSATPVSIPYAGGNLNGLAQAINTANAGVQATVVNVGSASTPDYRLSVQSNQAGQQSVQLSDGNQNLLAPSGTVGALAQYTVDGKQITSTTDTVTLAPGLTVMLTGTRICWRPAAPSARSPSTPSTE